MKTNITATALICNPDGRPENESLLLELERIGRKTAPSVGHV